MLRIQIQSDPALFFDLDSEDRTASDPELVDQNYNSNSNNFHTKKSKFLCHIQSILPHKK